MAISSPQSFQAYPSLVLAKDGNFANVTAIDNKKESVLQSFTSGLEDPYKGQRILEKDVDLEAALESAEMPKRAKTDAVFMNHRKIKQQLP